MAQKVGWTLPASRDLEHIVQFISKDSRHYAQEFVTEAQLIASRLILFPRRGRKVPELNNSSIREVFISNYRLIYQVAENNILVLALIHGSRDLFALWHKQKR